MITKTDLPHELQAITPYFTVNDADKLITFLNLVFDASVILDKRYDDNTVQHARVRISDSIIMINQSTEDYPANVSQIHLYVNNADIAFSKALAAGAIALMEPNTRPHGDRMAGVKDPTGNIWWIATKQ